jgi:CheY-like chemotaxis protein
MVTALIVDDLRLKHEMIMFVLRKCGVTHIVTADSFASAQRFMDQPFDYFIIDYNLGDGNGVDLITSYTMSINTKAIVYTCCIDTVPEKDRLRVIPSEILFDEIEKMINSNKKLDGAHISLSEKVCAIAEKVERHDVVIPILASDVASIKKEIKEGFTEIRNQTLQILLDIKPLKDFAAENLGSKDEIKTRVTIGFIAIGSVITTFCAFIGFKVWYK